MLILLSPSKTQEFEKAQTHPKAGIPALIKETVKLVPVLKKLRAADIEKLMDISPKLASLTHERYRNFHIPFTPQNAKPCLFVFQGDVYEGLNAATLSAAEITKAQNSLRILSGFYGLLRPLDLIQPYRLEMGIKLATPNAKNLYEFWKKPLTDELNRQAEEAGAKTILNLASEEYFSAIDQNRLRARFVTASFLENKDGKPRVIGLFAKKARGVMARYVISNAINKPEDLKSFREGGYKYVSALSGGDNIAFLR